MRSSHPVMPQMLRSSYDVRVITLCVCYSNIEVKSRRMPGPRPSALYCRETDKRVSSFSCQSAIDTGRKKRKRCGRGTFMAMMAGESSPRKSLDQRLKESGEGEEREQSKHRGVSRSRMLPPYI